MEHLELAIPTLFGLEGLAADELRRLDLSDVRAENGRVLCAARRSAGCLYGGSGEVGEGALISSFASSCR